MQEFWRPLSAQSGRNPASNINKNDSNLETLNDAHVHAKYYDGRNISFNLITYDIYIVCFKFLIYFFNRNLSIRSTKTSTVP